MGFFNEEWSDFSWAQGILTSWDSHISISTKVNSLALGPINLAVRGIFNKRSRSFNIQESQLSHWRLVTPCGILELGQQRYWLGTLRHQNQYENHWFKITSTSPIVARWVYSLSPSVACMRQWTGSPSVQVMACCLFGAKPLPEPMPPLSSIRPLGTNFSEIRIKIQTFHSCKFI